ncbi:MAG: hypothetical protein US70_C0005G0025 [Parcubacteria group bacterium GW2011_GWD2_38_11]|nr:MAG: hypothetical protein US70_C0005G0025 [Parcubacteria group bacterium GW2011_GWD2_38_11]
MMKKNAGFAEVPINVTRLNEVLYETYYSNKKEIDVPSRIKDIYSFATILKTNITGGKVNDFLKQIRKLFYSKENTQNQILITDFINDTLEPFELATLAEQIKNASRRILSPKMKLVIIAELH